MGGFDAHYSVSVPDNVNGIRVVDFDGQHGVDIAFSMQGASGVGVLVSSGIGTQFADSNLVTATLPYAGLSSAIGITAIQEGLSVADVDGVNGIDLISMANSGSTGYAVIWHNNGNGTFSTTPDTLTLLQKPIVIIPADYDQDGFVDLLATGFTGYVSMHMNNNNSGFHPSIDIGTDLSYSSIRELHVADINLDTYPDIIFPTIESLSDYRTDVFLNDKSGRFGDKASFYVGGQWIQIGDLNNDGLYDISGVNTSANQIVVSLGDAPGSFHNPGVPLKGESVAITTGDINGDGRVDIVSSHNRKYYTYLQNPDSTFTGTLIFASDVYRVTDVALVDLNNDSKLDLVGLATGRRFVNLGNGDGTFGPIDSYATPSRLKSDEYLFLDDFTNDGYIDLITKQTTGDSLVALYVNNQDGSFAAPTYINIPNGRVGYGDINNDNYPDLIYTAGSTVYVTFNDGTGNFPNNDLSFDATSYFYVADYDKDGLQDILFANEFYLNNGDSTFTSTPQTGLSLSSVLAMSDLDGDGDYDFITSSSGQFRTAINDGAGTFATEGYFMYRSLQSSAAADLNNDGRMDVVMGYGAPNVNTNFTRELMFISYNNGHAPPPCCTVAGDANNDAKVNIGDVSYLIQMIFLEGDSPNCCEAGDSDGNGTVNIGDVTVLIGVIFIAGDAPICGPTDMTCGQ